MSKISAQDIEAISGLEENFRRVIERAPQQDQIDDRFDAAKAVIQNIVTQADAFMDVTADNLNIALNVVYGALNRAVEMLDKSSVEVCLQYLEEVREISASYDPSI